MIVTWAVLAEKPLNQAVPTSLAGLVAGMLLGVGSASSALALLTSLLSFRYRGHCARAGGILVCVCGLRWAKNRRAENHCRDDRFQRFRRATKMARRFTVVEWDGSPYLLKFFAVTGDLAL